MPRQKKVRIVRRDFERAIATETSPNETPIIFSNTGFYRHCVEQYKDSDSINSFIFGFVVLKRPPTRDYSRPYKYRIRKSSLDFRTLSLLHPSAQWSIAKFYESYSGQILHFCSGSKFSIRNPASIANTVYLSPSRQAPATTNLRIRDSSDRFSFFAYAGYDRLYKFFNSNRFVNLESRYPVLLKLDVSKCFDSIYTHSITWATRHKQYAKANPHIRAFANDFDVVMQKSNYNETNGIPIGPETSRIFSEVIFQDIDRSVEEIVSSQLSMLPTRDYEVARYIDDIFIFAANSKAAEDIYEVYLQELAAYNLHLNKAKTALSERPFFTSKSKVIRDVNLCINTFVESFLRPSSDRKSLIAAKIFKRNHLIRSFVDSIKSSCVQNGVAYDEVVPYIVSALMRRSSKLAKSKRSTTREEPENYYQAAMALLEASLFFYGVAPAVTASYDLCITVITLHKFAGRHFPRELPSVRQLVHEGCLRLFEGSWGKARSDIDGFVFLEAINIALATCTHGPDFMIPADKLKSVLPPMSKAGYFQLTSIIFYCKDDLRYDDLKREAVSEIDLRVRDLSDVQRDAHLAHILLDALCCPYIATRKRKKWLARLYKVAGEPLPTDSALEEFLRNSPRRPWFTDWLEADLLAALGRKKLHQAYA